MMTTFSFSVTKINSIRRQAAKAARITEELCPEGWSKGPIDPTKVLALFTALRIKSGFVFRAYQFRAMSDGNGIVWALPKAAEFPEPVDCLQRNGDLLKSPRPPAAIDDFREVFEGDGSPWSYLSASILARELMEFGAMWHGCDWSESTILGCNPWAGKKSQIIKSPAEDWEWSEPMPTDWQPQVTVDEGIVVVTFFTYTELGRECIIRHTDTFKVGSYLFQAEGKTMCTGKGVCVESFGMIL